MRIQYHMAYQEPTFPVRDDEAYDAKLKELLSHQPQREYFDMEPYREAEEFACTTRFSKVATRCLGGDWEPLMEWAVEIAKADGIAAAVTLWFKVSKRVKKEWVFRRGAYGNPLGPKKPFS